MRVLIQAGHSSSLPPYYVQNGGGAPGEAGWTTAMAQALQAALAPQGVETVLVGHWFDAVKKVTLPAPAEAGEAYDLALALHYDADLSSQIPDYNTGCFGDRALNDGAAAESDRFLTLWQQQYPQATGISLHTERRNGNTNQYYAYAAVRPEVPMVLLEHGVGMGLDHDILYGQQSLVVQTDTACVLQFLGVQESDVSLTEDQKAALVLLAQLGAGEQSIRTWVGRLGRAAEIGRVLDVPRIAVATRRSLAQELERMNQ